jgi:hypothetical protein
VDLLELRNHKLQALCDILLGVCDNDVLKHRRFPFIDIKLVVFGGMKIGVCVQSFPKK